MSPSVAVAPLADAHWLGILRAAAEPAAQRYVPWSRIGYLDLSFGPSTLRTVHHCHYATLDRILRSASLPGAYTESRPSFVSDDPQVAETMALFVCACHHDGRIRERALRAAEGRSGRFVLGAALLRGGDEVAQVRAQARRLIDASLREDPGAILEMLDLALLLRRRRPRFERGAWSESIEPFLRGAARADLRRAALAHRDGDVRLWALQAVCALDPQAALPALERALSDPIPAIGMWALREFHLHADPATLNALLARAHELPHCVQRAEALRLIQRRGLANARERLETALFDPAFGPRRTAARLLRAHHGIDSAAVYRPALDGHDPERARVALVALSPYTTTTDLDALERMQRHASPRVRRYALRGLAAACAPDLAAQLRQALASPEPALVDFAAKAVTRNHRSPDPDSLAIAWRAHGWGLSRPLLRAARRLPRYDELALLLSLLSQESESWRQPPLQQALHRWCGRSRRRPQAQVPAEQAATLRQSLAQIFDRVEPGLYEAIARCLDGPSEEMPPT